MIFDFVKLKKLEIHFFIAIIRSIVLICIIFFPFIYLVDMILGDAFSVAESLRKLPFRYSTVLPAFSLWGVFFGVKSLRVKHTDLAFVSIGFRKRDGFKVLIIISFLFAFFDSNIFIPSNELFFKEKVKISKWAIQKDAEDVFFVHKVGDHAEVWFTQGKDLNIVNVQENYFIKQPEGKKVDITSDYYVVWNEYKKLSFKGLRRCENHMKKNGFDVSEVVKQRHIFFARVVLLLAMFFCGFAFAWLETSKELILCTIVANWVLQLSVFLPLDVAKVALWFNDIFWMVIGLCYLFF